MNIIYYFNIHTKKQKLNIWLTNVSSVLCQTPAKLSPAENTDGMLVIIIMILKLFTSTKNVSENQISSQSSGRESSIFPH